MVIFTAGRRVRALTALVSVVESVRITPIPVFQRIPIAKEDVRKDEGDLVQKT
jgi:hypothetical protein